MVAYPTIGLSVYLETASWGVWSKRAALLPATYLDALADARAVPVLLPPSLDARASLRGVDGLVLVGGPDIDARLYGEQRHPSADEPRVERDAWELELLAGAMDLDLPVLGICRGMQLINVARGGRLNQALEAGDADSLHRPRVGVFGEHSVRVSPLSWHGQVLGNAARVATYHHQSVNVVGSNLRAVAHAEDGCIEAIESCCGTYLLGVQWHPEEDPDRTLIRGFVELCQPGKRTRVSSTTQADEGKRGWPPLNQEGVTINRSTRAQLRATCQL